MTVMVEEDGFVGGTPLWGGGEMGVETGESLVGVDLELGGGK